MATISITSNEGALVSASAVLKVTATRPEYLKSQISNGEFEICDLQFLAERGWGQQRRRKCLNRWSQRLI